MRSHPFSPLKIKSIVILPPCLEIVSFTVSNIGERRASQRKPFDKKYLIRHCPRNGRHCCEEKLHLKPCLHVSAGAEDAEVFLVQLAFAKASPKPATWHLQPVTNSVFSHQNFVNHYE